MYVCVCRSEFSIVAVDVNFRIRLVYDTHIHLNTPNDVLFFCVWIRHSTKSMLILIGYSSIGIHDSINIDFYVHIYLFNSVESTHTHQHKPKHSHIQTMCDRESRKQKYAIQTTNASIIHAATDWHSHTYAAPHTYNAYSERSFFGWARSSVNKVALWPYRCMSAANRHCQCTLRRCSMVRDFKFSMVALFMFSCVHILTSTHSHSQLWYEWWAIVFSVCVWIYLRVPVCCVVVWVRWCSVYLCCRDLFFSLLTSLHFTWVFLFFCFHFTSHSKCVYLSVHIRSFQCVRLIRFLVLVVQLN